MLTYRYTYIGSRLIVYEYEGGRRGHRYEGRFAANGIGVTLFPMRGGYDSDSDVPYVKKHTNIFQMRRLPDYDEPTPIEPKARVGTRADEPAPEPIDNSAHTGVQIKLII